MANFDHSELKGDDASHLEKHEPPDTSSNDFVDIPAGYFPVTPEEKSLSRALNLSSTCSYFLFCHCSTCSTDWTEVTLEMLKHRVRYVFDEINSTYSSY